MPIRNPKKLLENRTFQKLIDLSVQLEKEDDILVAGDFGRSPYHLIKFLIIYAALSTENRGITLIKINTLATDHSMPIISQEELDALIVEMDWNSILDKSNTPSQVSLSLQIELDSPADFLSDAKSNCLPLHNALQNPQCMVQVCNPLEVTTDENKIIFRTTVKQAEKWKHSFYEKRGYWKVDGFNLSSDFLARIKKMTSQQAFIEGFEVIRGALPSYELYLPTPPRKMIESYQEFGGQTYPMTRMIEGDYAVKEELMPEPQLYNCFKDLRNIFGLTVIEVVKVKIESEGNLTADGVDVQQVDEVEFGEGCCPSTNEIVQEPTRIIARGLNIVLRESGISVQFLKSLDETVFNEKIYIQLETQSGAEVLLMNAKPDAIQSLAMMNTPLSLRSSSGKQVTVSDSNYGWFGKAAPGSDAQTDSHGLQCWCVVS